MLKTNQFFFSDTSTLSEVLKTLKRLNSGHLEKRKASYSISQIYMEYIKSCLILFDSMDCTTLGFPCLSLSPRQSFTVSSLSFTNSLSLCSKLCPLSQGCHLTISSSVAHFSSCPQSFPAERSFPMSQLFTSGGQSIGASASASVLPMNIQSWFPYTVPK